MTKTLLPALCLLAALVQNAESFSSEVTRRQAFVKTVNTIAGGIATTVALPNIASAVITEETPRVTTRMGGNLVGSVFTSMTACIIVPVVF